MKTIVYSLFLIFFMFSTNYLLAQDNETEITFNEKKQIIDSVSIHLKEHYIFPEITNKLIALLNKNLNDGNYDNLKSHEQFGPAITKDLRSLNNDRHLWIWYNPDWIKNELARIDNLARGIDKGLMEAKKNNFGFKEIKILEGNIGYWRFDEFSEYPEALETINGGFQFLQNVDALIIDLRNNIGGAPEMVQLLCSYFFKGPSILLNTLQYKKASKVNQYWSYFFVPGPRLIKQSIYILVNGRTASAAEEFVYNLQNLERATIIGEKTRGAGHHNKFIILNDNYFMSVSIARAINPITNSNWEGIGIKPDIEVESEIAFINSYKLALTELLNKSEDNEIKEQFRMLLKKLEKEPIEFLQKD